MLIAYVDMLCYCKVYLTWCVSFIETDTHTKITNSGILPRKVYARGQSGVAEAQIKNEDQPQLAITAEIAELRQAV